MSFGKAVIAPSLGCFPEVIDNIGSFIYNPNERDGLFYAMKKFLSDNLDIKKMGEHNLSLAKKFSWNKMAYKTNYIYTKIL